MMTKRWTILLYLAGDNNLQEYGARDLEELKSVGSTEQLNLVAQFDTMGDGTTRRYYLTPGEALSGDVVAELAETNSGDPAALVDFVHWGLDAYPAEHVALILWNHGMGWKDDDIYARTLRVDAQAPRSLVRGIQTRRIGHALFASSIQRALAYPAEVRGILFDDTSRDFLDNQELSCVLEQVVAARHGVPLDVIAFDACLMSMIEVASQVGSAARFMIGSQEIEPGDGYPYDRLARMLADAPETTPEAFASSLVRRYVTSYWGDPSNFGITQSALRLSSLPALVEGVDALSRALLERISERAFYEGTLMPSLRATQKFHDEEYIDLYHFAGLIIAHTQDNQLQSLARAVLEGLEAGAVQSTIVAQEHRGHAVEHAHGLSIYLPLMGTVSPAYAMLDFAHQSHWAAFLHAFLRA